ncbi:hypothetical protein DUNSADRAFT_2392 [Dunaliella salina]|uniref:Uncharacterized protein n=1 Tax=Dunaliella salina TaxID=3046 RepID=A0ABQ7GVQ8_DUNSA|nr:hypothetical protein DUNSADRAFT_2392 [Dunaliella salina]|eukprot:KAF5838696.1 hypothetical protein DUNSADRAFT_2392 [Dunaliella salina]
MGNSQSSSSLRRKAGSGKSGGRKEERSVGTKAAQRDSSPTNSSPAAGTHPQYPTANAIQQSPKAKPLQDTSTDGPAPLHFVPMLPQKQPPSLPQEQQQQKQQEQQQQQQQQQQRHLRASSSMHSRSSMTTGGSATTFASTDTFLLSDDQHSPGFDSSRLQTLHGRSSLLSPLAQSNMLRQPSAPLSPSGPQSQPSAPLSPCASQPQPSAPQSPSCLQSQPSVPLSPSGRHSQPLVTPSPSGRMHQGLNIDQHSPGGDSGLVNRGLSNGGQHSSSNSDSAKALEVCVDLLMPQQQQQQQQQSDRLHGSVDLLLAQQQQQQKQQQQESQVQKQQQQQQQQQHELQEQQQLQQQQGQGNAQQGLPCPHLSEPHIIHAPRLPKSLREKEAAAEQATAGTTAANGKDAEEVQALLESAASCQTGLGLSKRELRHSYSAPGDCNEAKSIILSLIYGRYIPKGKRLPQQAQDTGGQGHQDWSASARPPAQPTPRKPPSRTASVLGVGSPALAEQFALIWGGGGGKGKGSRRQSSRRSSRNASSFSVTPNSSFAFPSPESPKSPNSALLALQQRRARKEYKPSQLSRALVSSFRFSQQTTIPEKGIAAECLRALNTGRKTRHASMLLAALPALGGLDAELEAELSSLHKEHKEAVSGNDHKVAGSSSEYTLAGDGGNEHKVAGSSNEHRVAGSSNEHKVAGSSSHEGTRTVRPSTLELLREARLRAMEEDDDEATNERAEPGSDEHSPSGAKAPLTPGSTASCTRTSKVQRVPSHPTSPPGFGSPLSPSSCMVHGPPSPVLTSASARFAVGAVAGQSPPTTKRSLTDAQQPLFTSASGRFVAGAAAELSPPSKHGGLADAYPAGVADEVSEESGDAARAHSSSSSGRLPIIGGHTFSSSGAGRAQSINGQTFSNNINSGGALSGFGQVLSSSGTGRQPSSSGQIFSNRSVAGGALSSSSAVRPPGISDQTPSSSSFIRTSLQHSSHQRVKQSHSFGSSPTSSQGVGSTAKLHKAPSLPGKDSTSSVPRRSLERGHGREGVPSTSALIPGKSPGGRRGSISMGLLSQALINSCALNPDQPVCKLVPVDQLPSGKKSAYRSSNSMASQLQAMSTPRTSAQQRRSKGSHSEGHNVQDVVALGQESCVPGQASSLPGRVSSLQGRAMSLTECEEVTHAAFDMARP